MPDNQYQELFDRQKRTFVSGVTRSYDWRVDQLDRMAKMVTEKNSKLKMWFEYSAHGSNARNEVAADSQIPDARNTDN